MKAFDLTYILPSGKKMPMETNTSEGGFMTLKFALADDTVVSSSNSNAALVSNIKKAYELVRDVRIKGTAAYSERVQLPSGNFIQFETDRSEGKFVKLMLLSIEEDELLSESLTFAQVSLFWRMYSIVQLVAQLGSNG